jgi:hypothetical protein
VIFQFVPILNKAIRVKDRICIIRSIFAFFVFLGIYVILVDYLDIIGLFDDLWSIYDNYGIFIVLVVVIIRALTV